MRALTLIGIAVAFAALRATLWLHSDAPGIPPTADVDSLEDSPSSTTVAESNATPRPRPPAAGDPHEGHDQPLMDDHDIWADPADPANSDLPTEVFYEAVDTASKVLMAGTTGEGRYHWPPRTSSTPSSLMSPSTAPRAADSVVASGPPRRMPGPHSIWACHLGSASGSRRPGRGHARGGFGHDCTSNPVSGPQDNPHQHVGWPVILAVQGRACPSTAARGCMPSVTRTGPTTRGGTSLRRHRIRCRVARYRTPISLPSGGCRVPSGTAQTRSTRGGNCVTHLLTPAKEPPNLLGVGVSDRLPLCTSDSMEIQMDQLTLALRVC